MKKKKKSGKRIYWEGLLLYFFEELKTMNVKKFRALKMILVGRIRMKLENRKGPKALPYHSRTDRKRLRSLES